MSDLFSELLEEESAKFSPLADLARPKTLEEIVGQEHLLGEGKPLYQALKNNKPHSMIFWGPPGVGKTTLANVIATYFDCEFIPLSAVFSGVKEIREAMKVAENNRLQGRQTLLFIDEIHRFNKAQQDALLPYIESGLVIFVGATTENPSFEVNGALLSRTFVYILEPLTEEALTKMVLQAIERYYPHFTLEKGALALIIQYAAGDGRRALNLTQQLLTLAETKEKTISEATEKSIEERQAQTGEMILITEAMAKAILSQQPKAFDKGGDYFYDQISALHKSVRGSHPDAALYWFSLMMESGADPLYLARRVLMIAWEDVGLADPRGVQIALSAYETYERLGSPEGDLALAQAVIYLASAAKSNAGYLAHKGARQFVKKDQTRSVPLHLRNAPTQLMKELGHGREYRYAHDEPYAYAAGESYFPEELAPQSWYQPTERGLEGKIKEKLAFLKSLDDKVES